MVARYEVCYAIVGPIYTYVPPDTPGPAAPDLAGTSKGVEDAPSMVPQRILEVNQGPFGYLINSTILPLVIADIAIENGHIFFLKKKHIYIYIIYIYS